MTAFVATVCAVLGLAIGSFLNVVIWRVPRGESVVRPPSHCPTCDALIKNRDNIPVVSWLLLRGRCRSCGSRISVRYPLVELATAGVFVALAIRIGAHPALPAYLWLGAVGVALAMIDIDVKRLPNSLTFPSYAVGLVGLALASLVDHSWNPYVHAVVGMVAAYAFYFLLAFAYPAGMGFGDVKLAGVLGIYLGWLGYGALVVGLFMGFLLGGLSGIVLLIGGRAGRKSKIPFGPFMLAGAFVAILVGHQIAQAYVDSTLG